jgi:hypothetical protein
MGLLSVEKGWQLGDVLKKMNVFSKVYTLVRCTDLRASACIRPTLKVDIQYWVKELKEGWDHGEHHIRAYVDADHQAAFDTLLNEVKGGSAYQRPFVEWTAEQWALVGLLFVIDGMHRVEAMCFLHKLWRSANPEKAEELSPFLFMKVLIYCNDVKSNLFMLSKACNDEPGKCIRETVLGRYTLVQQTISNAGDILDSKLKVKGKFPHAVLARFLLRQAGVTDEDELKKRGNYHSQLVGIALSLQGEKTKWLIAEADLLSQLTGEANREVTPSHHYPWDTSRPLLTPLDPC